MHSHGHDRSWVGNSRQWVPRCAQWSLCKGSRLTAESQDHPASDRVRCHTGVTCGRQGGMSVMSTQCHLEADAKTLMLMNIWTTRPWAGVKLHSASAAVQGSLQVQFYIRHQNHHLICQDFGSAWESSTIIKGRWLEKSSERFPKVLCV